MKVSIIAVLSALVSSAAYGQSAPPVRWWNAMPSTFLESRLNLHKRQSPDSFAQAETIAKKYETKITDYRMSIKDQLTRHETEREELRKLGYQGNNRQAWAT